MICYICDFLPWYFFAQDLIIFPNLIIKLIIKLLNQLLIIYY